MLTEVRIENLAVIEELSLALQPGFTALTGETGAGKSLLIQALGLVAGGRANIEALRPGAERALVEASITLANADAVSQLSEQGYGDDARVVVRRLIAADGNHRVYLNGRMATAQLLQDLVGPELEIHAQHSQQRLLEPGVQTALLDRFGGLEATAATVAERYRAWRAAAERLAELEGQGANREQELDFLRFQLGEFDRIAPKPGEDQELRAEVRRLRGQATVGEAAAGVRQQLVDGEGCAVDRLFNAQEALTQAARYVDAAGSLAERLGAVVGELKDVVREADRLGGGGDDEVGLDALEARLAELDKLVRKHGGDLDGALAERERMAANIAELEALDERVAHLKREAADAEAGFKAAAAELSEARQAVAADLADRVTASLRELDMPHAVLAIGGWGEGRPGPGGVDRVEVRLAANPGDPPRALRKVASGGELSRVLLALQGTVGTELADATVVFDEVDTGVGGETALVVGARMRKLGERAQVLAVTHTPQVAAAAHHQLHLAKEVAAGRARTLASELAAGDREAELARMLGSRDRATALDHARTLLNTAQAGDRG